NAPTGDSPSISPANVSIRRTSDNAGPGALVVGLDFRAPNRNLCFGACARTRLGLPDWMNRVPVVHLHSLLASRRRISPRGSASGHAAGTAAEQRDELAPLHLRDHSITSSARASSVAGTSRPSVFAVCRLMTNSNLVGCSTGGSPGLAPFRMRPV